MAHEFPTISVITPSFNQGCFLAETIESVISQKGDFSLDYIIIDGGSKDNSVDIIKHYENLLENNIWKIRCKGISFRWISEKDQGQTDAIMKGFGFAEGEILAWLNSDDLYLPGALDRVISFFSDEPSASIVYGKTHFTDESGDIIGKYPTMAFDEKLLPIFNFVCQPSVFFRKTAFQEVGGLDMTLDFVMDYDLWIRLSRKSPFFYVDEFLSTYRLHETSKTISSAAALANHTEALKIVVKHYGWAPLNRVYGYCFQTVKFRYPAMNTHLAILLSLGMTAVKYTYMNKRVRFADMKMISRKNMRKLSKDQTDIFKEY